MVIGKTLGGSIGGLLGFLISSSIPTGEDIALSFFQRMGNINSLISYPKDFFINLSLVLFAILFLGILGTAIGHIFDSFNRSIATA